MMWKPPGVPTVNKEREVGARRRSARFIGHVIARAVLTFEEVITKASNVREKPRLRCVRSKQKKRKTREKAEPVFVAYIFAPIEHSYLLINNEK